MSPLEIILLVGLILLTVGGSLGLTFAGLGWFSRKEEKAMRERFPSAKAVVGANFFGQQSKGMTQLRGNGTLVLTDADIYFEKWLPRTEYRIPLASIQSLETPNAFLGKTIGRPLLKVTYQLEGGQTDAIAWWVKDVAYLKDLIENTRG